MNAPRWLLGSAILLLTLPLAASGLSRVRMEEPLGAVPGELLEPAFSVISVSGGPCGEPTIGVTAVNNIFFRCNRITHRSVNNGTSWTGVRLSDFLNLDPMDWVDPVTSRIFHDDLWAVCSNLVYSDDEGATWKPINFPGNLAACGTPVNDHQKIVTGPWVPGSPRNLGLYSRATFYCYNGVAYSGCALSPDGGLTWEPAVPTTALAGVAGAPTLDRGCFGLHGHPHIASSGKIYLPHVNCGANSLAFSFSADEGLTWKTRSAGSPASDGQNDPDVASTPNGRVWSVYIARTTAGGVTKNIPYLAHTDNDGASFTTLAVGLGTSYVNTSTFPAIAAGDDGRVAVGFLGTTSVGGTGGAGGVPSSAVWHAYVAITYDNGTTWTTTQVSSDPVQRGTICMAGISCGADRNLLDFNDMTLDTYGTVLYAFADGCISATCTGASGTAADSRAAAGRIARQTSGDTLYSAWDAFFS